MIYFNNAGTTWPKPDVVHDALNNFNKATPDQWLSNYNESIQEVANFFKVPDLENFLITNGCTSSLAIAMNEFHWNPGDRLIISHMEHHALSRWFHILQRDKQVIGTVIPRADNGPFDIELLEEELKKGGVRMVAISMASNVTGEILPYQQVIELAHKYGTYCLLDGAQLAGVQPIDLKTLQADIFTFAGHKAPFGPQGIGGLFIDKKVPMSCPTAACEIVPGKKHSAFPDYCDTGSVNLAGLVGLAAGIDWLDAIGWDKIINSRHVHLKRITRAIQANDSITILGTADPLKKTGVVSFTSAKTSPSDVSKALKSEYNIKVGSGFMCSPMTHEALGTHENGCVRISVSPLTTDKDVSILVEALKKLL